MKRKGFTLIELLIVVAIIAILAAIAVPNFLEAQTRAKVSRVMADMRTIATAIEAYTVDYNRPILDYFEWQGATLGATLLGLDWALVPLTTPVAYMTTIPRDPFARRTEDPSILTHPRYMTSTGYGIMSPDHNDPSDPAALFYGPRSNYRWVLDSRGPDLVWEWLRAVNPQDWLWAGDVVYYDATNGTRSQGDIYCYGPGGGINPAPATSR
jgi:prepilin-type N-terminal cleavage/methylation domain-containing protein